MAVSYLDRQVLGVLAPTITRDLHVSNEAYGWLASAFSIAYLVGPPIAGRFLDHTGVRRGLPVAVIGWSIVAALHAAAPNFAVLFALRILLGLAESPTFPGAVQTVRLVFRPADQSRAVGILFTGSSLGALAAPLIASYLAVSYGWRAAFFITPLAGLIWVPLWFAATASPVVRIALDRPAAALPDSELTPKRPGFELLRHPAVIRAALVTLACAPAYAFVLLWGAKYLADTYNVTQAQIGSYLWLPPLFFDCGSVVFGTLASRHAKKHSVNQPPRLIFSVAMLLTASCALSPLAEEAKVATFTMCLISAGVGGLYTLLTADMLLRVPMTAVSTASGITAAAQSLAFIITSPLIGWSVTHYQAYTIPLIGLGCCAIPGCILWLWKKPPVVVRA